MGKTYDITPPTELINQLSSLERNIGNIKQDMLDAGAKVAETAIIRKLGTVQSTVRESRAEEAGTLKRSVTTIKGKNDRLVTFLGTRNRKGRKVRNNEIAAYLEYGVSERNQSPRPFVRTAMQESGGEISKAMEKEFEKHVPS